MIEYGNAFTVMNDFPIEKLGFNSDRTVVGSVSHNNFVRLWNANVLQEDSEGEESEDEAVSKPAATKASGKASAKDDSEDDWEDEDEGSDSDGDSDSDDSDEDEEAPTMNDRRKKRLKTDNEKFFDDL